MTLTPDIKVDADGFTVTIADQVLDHVDYVTAFGVVTLAVGSEAKAHEALQVAFENEVDRLIDVVYETSKQLAEIQLFLGVEP